MSYAFVSFVNLCLLCNFVISLENGNGSLLNSDLVKIVREDLRRNNEDYKEMKYAKNLTSDDKLSNGSKTRRVDTDTSDYNYDDLPKLTSDVVKVVSADTRIVLNTVTEKVLQTSNKITKAKLPKTVNKDVIQNTVTFPTTIRSFIKIVNQTKNTKHHTNNDIPKFVNKNKIQKFKNFMEKNKGLLKNFLSSKIKETPQITSKNPLRQNVLDFDKLVNSAESSPEVGGAIRNVDKLYKKNELQLPSPDLLDLAPARGGRIHKQRVKGRLCQRHVLVPEGPKYDSQGKWYLPAHKLLVRRPYNVTHRPKLVLPRCCNCCKKSVLGCE